MLNSLADDSGSNINPVKKAVGYQRSLTQFVEVLADMERWEVEMLSKMCKIEKTYSKEYRRIVIAMGEQMDIKVESLTVPHHQDRGPDVDLEGWQVPGWSGTSGCP